MPSAWSGLECLRSVLGNRGHATISSSEEDTAREGSEEDNGSGWAGQR